MNMNPSCNNFIKTDISLENLEMTIFQPRCKFSRLKKCPPLGSDNRFTVGLKQASEVGFIDSVVQKRWWMIFLLRMPLPS